ncbi:hypothetical protein SAMN05660860_02247 [Geoalkalibacter ferrihydriticus]|uniref:Alpha/beta hydrolase n=2 Tax=Geoalkalibacter ferrihydriticus TaxID=392333 RepID=A0A0C2EHB6_9BACT|nr:hypothetical protein [Geoalkalibacter ferrihydriticus]KIH78068.1 hypothetical protein GFER_05635 [Geoalkalibacter ferrihydriticus DSM 17813]SDM30810.1 hypothetical protein SAMN05660860_02247 [Geoalkalibacter ferrihydriticus]
MLVIIHGWSDEYASFRSLAQRLVQKPPEGVGADVAEIHLADYLSLDDQVTFHDLVEAMQKAWTDRNLPTAPRSVDAIVHSTGGLVIRDWLTRMYEPDNAPIRRLLMLAPANFGSPLAHTGRSLIGRAIKGWKGTRLFETGTQILKGLELASSYSWELAERDLFSDRHYYGPGRILCTVLTGNAGYRGISSVANKPGTDGTVRVSTANLAALRMNLDFSGTPDAEPEVSFVAADESGLAFTIADEEDHSTIAAKGRGTRKTTNWELITGALQVEDSGFAAWRQQLRDHTAAVTDVGERRRGNHYDSYQNTVVRVTDNHGARVQDYLLEFYVNNDKKARDQRLTQRFQEQVLSGVHAYSGDKSYRSLLINCTELHTLLPEAQDRLNISITAYPDLIKGKVGYRTYTDQDIGALSLNSDQVRELFQPHRTLLINLCLKRYQQDDVFRFKSV